MGSSESLAAKYYVGDCVLTWSGRQTLNIVKFLLAAARRQALRWDLASIASTLRLTCSTKWRMSSFSVFGLCCSVVIVQWRIFQNNSAECCRILTRA